MDGSEIWIEDLCLLWFQCKPLDLKAEAIGEGTYISYKSYLQQFAWSNSCNIQCLWCSSSSVSPKLVGLVEVWRVLYLVEFVEYLKGLGLLARSRFFFVLLRKVKICINLAVYLIEFLSFFPLVIVNLLLLCVHKCMYICWSTCICMCTNIYLLNLMR